MLTVNVQLLESGEIENVDLDLALPTASILSLGIDRSRAEFKWLSLYWFVLDTQAQIDFENK